MRKILLSSLGLLGLAAVALPPGGAEARDLVGVSVVQTAPAAAEQGIAAEDQSAASRRRARRARRGGNGGGATRQ